MAPTLSEETREMKFLYTTDLHGNIHKYQQILDFAKTEGYQLIHLGADLLPNTKGRKILE